MKLYDMHLHTKFSGDSEADPYAVAEAAVKKGLAGICFTDHVDPDYPVELDISFDVDMMSYFPELLSVKKSFEDVLDVRVGIELGLQTHIVDELNSFVKTYPQLDFIIGSSHVVNRKDPYYPEYFEGRSEKEAYMEYFESVLANIKVFDGFDAYGHIDYIVRYGPNKNRFFSYSEYGDVIDEILKELIHRGKGIEINTAGFRYGLDAPNPCADILKRYRELGGEIVTLGSDAHKPEDVGSDFKRAVEVLKGSGIKYIANFKSRKPVMQSL